MAEKEKLVKMVHPGKGERMVPASLVDRKKEFGYKVVSETK